MNNLAGYNYTLRDLGDGFAMFDGAVNVLDYVMEDYMVLANYVKGFTDGIVGAENSPLNAKYAALGINYSEVTGDGRIKLVDGSVEEDVTPPEEGEDVIPPTGDIAVILLGISTILSMGAVSVLKKRG